jgi:hypothetical protein
MDKVKRLNLIRQVASGEPISPAPNVTPPVASPPAHRRGRGPTPFIAPTEPWRHRALPNAMYLVLSR